MPFHLESLGRHVNAAQMLCDRLGRNKIVRVDKSSGPVLSQVHGILDSYFWFRTPLPDCQCHVSFRRYSSLSLEIVEKPNKCKTFLIPNFFRETTPTVLRQTVSAIYCPPLGKVWLFRLLVSVSEAWQWSKQIIYVGWVKVWRRLWTKLHDISHDVWDPL